MENETIECKMITGTTWRLKPKTVEMNNRAIDQFIDKAGSVEKAKEIMSNNYICQGDVDGFLAKTVQAYPIYYAFLREYCRVKKLESKLQEIIEYKNNQINRLNIELAQLEIASVCRD